MLAGQTLDEAVDDGAAGAAARVPADPERPALEALEQAVDITVHHRLVGDRAGALFPIALRRHPAERLDALAEKGLVAKDHLEAVIIGRGVAAGDRDAAVDA